MPRPYVIIGGFMSLDGKTAPRDRDGLKFAPYLPAELQQELHQIRANVDAVVIGIGTVLAYDYRQTPKLTVRLVPGRNPTRVVLDSLARLPLDAAILNRVEAPTIVATTERAPTERIAALRGRGAEVIICGATRVDVPTLLDQLAIRGIHRVLVEGGAELRWSFVQAGAVDEVFVWIFPAIWGGRDAPTLVDGEGFSEAGSAFGLRFVEVQRRSGVLMLKLAPEQVTKS